MLALAKPDTQLKPKLFKTDLKRVSRTHKTCSCWDIWTLNFQMISYKKISPKETDADFLKLESNDHSQS